MNVKRYSPRRRYSPDREGRGRHVFLGQKGGHHDRGYSVSRSLVARKAARRAALPVKRQESPLLRTQPLRSCGGHCRDAPSCRCSTGCRGRGGCSRDALFRHIGCIPACRGGHLHDVPFCHRESRRGNRCGAALPEPAGLLWHILHADASNAARAVAIARCSCIDICIGGNAGTLTWRRHAIGWRLGDSGPPSENGPTKH